MMTWKENLIEYYNKNGIENIKDNILTNNIYEYFIESNKSIIIFYGKNIEPFYQMSLNNSCENSIYIPVIEGTPPSLIDWPEYTWKLPSPINVKINYMIMDETCAPLYEWKLINKKYQIVTAKIPVLVSTIIDIRTTKSIESRYLLKINSVWKNI